MAKNGTKQIEWFKMVLVKFYWLKHAIKHSKNMDPLS